MRDGKEEKNGVSGAKREEWRKERSDRGVFERESA